MIRIRKVQTRSARSGFDPELQSSFFLIQTISVTGQNFLSVLKMAASVYERDNCSGGSFSAWVTMAIKADNFVWRKYYLLIVIIPLKDSYKRQ